MSWMLENAFVMINSTVGAPVNHGMMPHVFTRFSSTVGL